MTPAPKDGPAIPGPLARPIPPRPQPQIALPISRRGFLAGGAALAAGMVAAALVHGVHRSAVQPDPDLSADQLAAREAAFTAHGPLALVEVPSSEIAGALDAMALAADQKQLLQADIQTGRVRLLWLTLWDDLVEDGDGVAIDSNGYTVSLVLKKTPTRIALPAPSNGKLVMRGTVDGTGGGITVAVMSGTTPLSLPVLKPGQTLAIPVSMP